MDFNNMLNYIIVIDLTIITILITILFIFILRILLNINKIINSTTKIINTAADISNNFTYLSLIPKTLAIKLSEFITVYIDDIINKKKTKDNTIDNEDFTFTENK